MSVQPQTQNVDISILPCSPIWKDPIEHRRIFNPTAYSHQLSASGGYLQATIVFNSSREYAEEWFSKGLGRDIKVYAPDGVSEIFHGFVDIVQVQMGALVATRGPLLDIVNRIETVYSLVLDTGGVQPIIGVSEIGATANDTDSQDEWGILQASVNIGEATSSKANRYRDTFLAERAQPYANQQISLGAITNPTVTLTVKGYVNFMSAYIYTDDTSGTTTISQRIQDIISGDPSSRLSTDYSFVSSNTFAIPSSEYAQASAMDIMKALNALGDASDNRYIFGVYQDRKMHYEQAPSAFEYFYRIHERRQRITTDQDIEVKPWNVKPGKWLLVSDWLIGDKVATTATREDARAQFVETVVYTMPYGLQLSGQKVDRLPQFVAKMGVGGESS